MSKIVTKAEKCAKCEKIVYSMEELKACDKIWHKQCFKCVHCGMVLSMKGFAAIEGDPYCKPHFLELFKQKGSYATFKEGDDAKSNSYNPITSFQGLHAGAPGSAGERKSYFPVQPKSPRLHEDKSPKTPVVASTPVPVPVPVPVAVAATPTTPSPPPAAKKEEPKKEEPKKEEPKKEEPKKKNRKKKLNLLYRILDHQNLNLLHLKKPPKRNVILVQVKQQLLLKLTLKLHPINVLVCLLKSVKILVKLKKEQVYLH